LKTVLFLATAAVSVPEAEDPFGFAVEHLSLGVLVGYFLIHEFFVNLGDLSN